MYSIFHTSFCGSTLLACLLSKSVPTITEPSWAHEIVLGSDLEKKLKIVDEKHYQGLLVKYQSRAYEIIPQFPGKSIFLYRNLKDHINKLKSVREIDEHYEIELYAARMYYASKSNNILYIETDELLNNRDMTVKTVCDYFEIEHKPVFIDFHVKSAGFNTNDNPINI